MKIRTQDANRYLEFGENYIEDHLDGAAVFVKSRYNHEAVMAGLYEDAARARGVLLEIGLAHSSCQRVFYMPAE